jgi:F-box/WD-40 domain protein MET30
VVPALPDYSILASSTPSHAMSSARTLTADVPWRTQLPPQNDDEMTSAAASDPHTALMHGHDHEGLARHFHGEDGTHEEQENNSSVKDNASKQLKKMITPYLAQHIPTQYNPLGGDAKGVPANGNTKFCYRHRPDLLCRKQADEPSMEQLQKVCLYNSACACDVPADRP